MRNRRRRWTRLSILDDEQKATIAAIREEDLIDLHFGLGMEICNAWLNQIDSYP